MHNNDTIITHDTVPTANPAVCGIKLSSSDLSTGCRIIFTLCIKTNCPSYHDSVLGYNLQLNRSLFEQCNICETETQL